LIDYDYLDKLTPDMLEYLNQFTEEFVNASFDKNPRKNLHKSKRLRKDCYDRNNARNRDILTKAKAQGKAQTFDQTAIDNITTYERTDEDTVISTIDEKRLLKK
jgi:hypothetical protein